MAAVASSGAKRTANPESSITINHAITARRIEKDGAMTEQRSPPRVFRQLMLDLGDVDDQIVPRKAQGWRRPKPAMPAKAAAPKKRRAPTSPKTDAGKP
jgi:hypothetical protein